MMLIADSGATKTDWRIVDNKDLTRQLVTAGINPHYQSAEQIITILEDTISKGLLPRKFKGIYFYGAGCSSVEKIDLIKSALEYTFVGSPVEVHSDVMGVARSLCGHQPGISCILGTGSAACQFDGKNIVDQVPSLGFVLGDEGSGAHLGKQLIAAYLRREFPAGLQNEFDNEFQVTKEIVLHELNTSKTPSRYLAGFAKFLGRHKNDPFFQPMIYSSFKVFIEKYVLPLALSQGLVLHFSGGIAYHFNSILNTVCSDLKLKLGKVVESPISGLTLYHLGEI